MAVFSGTMTTLTLNFIFGFLYLLYHKPLQKNTYIIDDIIFITVQPACQALFTGQMSEP